MTKIEEHIMIQKQIVVPGSDKMHIIAVCTNSLVMISIDLSDIAHLEHWKSETMSETIFFLTIFFFKNFFMTKNIFSDFFLD